MRDLAHFLATLKLGMERGLNSGGWVTKLLGALNTLWILLIPLTGSYCTLTSQEPIIPFLKLGGCGMAGFWYIQDVGYTFRLRVRLRLKSQDSGDKWSRLLLFAPITSNLKGKKNGKKIKPGKRNLVRKKCFSHWKAK
jgi:hypothetical protein